MIFSPKLAGNLKNFLKATKISFKTF